MVIKIVGAGIAGLSCAIKLADSGHNVEIFERESSIGGNEMDNLKAIRNYELKEDFLNTLKKNNLKVKHIKPINKITKYAPSGKKMVVHSDNNALFYIIKKGHDQKSIDYQLYKQALDLGVKVRLNENKTLRSGDIIAVNSIFRNIWAYGAMFKDVKVDEKEILFFMDDQYAPSGYIYAIPNGKYEIGIAATTLI